MNKIPDEIKSLSFEQAYQQLEETVQKLEAGQLSLEDALALYQRGIVLAQHCNFQLDQADLTVKRLTPEGDLAALEDI
jgi:exodeoxyribonuclease VII small subunit